MEGKLMDIEMRGVLLEKDRLIAHMTQRALREHNIEVVHVTGTVGLDSYLNRAQARGSVMCVISGWLHVGADAVEIASKYKKPIVIFTGLPGDVPDHIPKVGKGSIESIPLLAQAIRDAVAQGDGDA